MEFYKYKYRNKISFLKVFDSIPEDRPEFLKDSKLIYYEESSIDKPPQFENSSKGEYVIDKKCFVSRENLETKLEIFEAKEISENEYNRGIVSITKVDTLFNEILSKI